MNSPFPLNIMLVDKVTCVPSLGTLNLAMFNELLNLNGLMMFGSAMIANIISEILLTWNLICTTLRFPGTSGFRHCDAES